MKTFSDKELFNALMEQNFPELYVINQLIENGHLTAQEIAEVAGKMAIVRSSDEGFGKIVVEMYRKEDSNWVRIRTIQDRVLKTIKEEEIL